MSPVFHFLPLLIVLALYAVSCRLAARVLRVAQVGWLRSFQFVGLFAALSIVGGLALMLLGQPPLVLGMLISLALQLTLGAWFFRERALAADGQPLGWAGGAKLTAVTFGFWFLTLAILAGVQLALFPNVRA